MISIGQFSGSNVKGDIIPIAYLTNISGAASIVLNNIPQTYQDLYLNGSVRVNESSTNYFTFRLNNVVSGYSKTSLIANGASLSSNRRSNDNGFFIQALNLGLAQSNAPCNFSFYIFNYRSTLNKTILWQLSFDQSGSGESSISTGTCTVPSITSLGISTDTGNVTFTGDSSLKLYGVKAIR